METGKDLSDPEITALIQSANNDIAIRYLYRKNYGSVLAYIIRNSGTDADAQDIFQEVIVTFLELVQLHKFRGESSVSTFLLALTRNIWLNELKKRGRAQLREERYEKGRNREEEDASQFVVHREMRMQVMNLLESIGTTCKTILLAFYYENRSMKDILDLLHYENEQVVRNKKYKCLKQLEQVLNAKPALANNIKSILSYE